MQNRLTELRYWLGPVDGSFGLLTQQAVFAFEKAQGIAVDGVVGASVRAALANPKGVGIDATGEPTFHVDKSRQLLVLTNGSEIVWIWNTSTGTERPYSYAGQQRVADTPLGTRRVYRQVDGWDDGPLGALYRPKYFHPDGIAIHGYPNVPRYAASHGCIRISIAAMDYIWSEGLAPIGTRVIVFGQTPRRP